MEKFIKENLIIEYKRSLGLNSVKLRELWFEKHNFISQYKEIIDQTRFLNTNSTMSERIYCILNDIKEKPLCLYCKKDRKYSSFGIGYREHCGSKECIHYHKANHKDKNGLTANQKSGIGVSKSQNTIMSNGKTKSQNSGHKQSITKQNTIINGLNMNFVAARKGVITKRKNIVGGLDSHKRGAIKSANTMSIINPNTGKSIKDERIDKMMNTKNKIGPDGLDTHERAFKNGAGRNSSIKYYNKNLYYQGTYEKNFLDLCTNWKKIDFINRGPRFDYTINDKKRQYRSDYLFNNVVFEIKSEWTYGRFDKNKRNKNHLKFKSVLDHPNFRLIIILDKNYFIEIDDININQNLYDLKLLEITKLKNILK